MGVEPGEEVGEPLPPGRPQYGGKLGFEGARQGNDLLEDGPALRAEFEDRGAAVAGVRRPSHEPLGLERRQASLRREAGGWEIALAPFDTSCTLILEGDWDAD